jgi:hypothetical protein
MAALDNEKRILNKLNQTYNLNLEKAKPGRLNKDLSVSVDFIWELKENKILFEVDSYNAAKIVFGQYILLNQTKEYQKKCIFLVIHCFKNYNEKRTEKYLNFAREKLNCKIPFLVFNELDWYQYVKAKNKKQFINTINKSINQK